METVSPATPSPVDLSGSGCPNCGFLAWCYAAHLSVHELKQFNDRIEHGRLVRRSQYVHHAGSAFTSIYVLNSGSLKTSIMDVAGREQIIAFPIPGDLVGVDAFGAGEHACDTVALEDSVLCGMHYADFEELGRAIPALQRYFHRVMGEEIKRDHRLMLLLGTMRAEERVAKFLLQLSKQFFARGCSGTHFRLSMTRQEIASYLGLTTETVSRVFSHFNSDQLIAIDNKDIEIKNVPRLREVVGRFETKPSPKLAREIGNELRMP